MIDLHSHVLYDIEGDDGSRSEAMSLELLRLAEASGTETLFVTPHCHRRGVVPRWQSITDIFPEQKAFPVHSCGPRKMS